MRRMLPLYLVYLIIVTLVVTGVSFSKYGTIVDGTDTARVAKPVLEYVPISAHFNEELLGSISGGLSFSDVKPGDELIYVFEIRNYEGEGLNKVINEVLLNYNIVVSVEPVSVVLPLQRTLTPEVEDWAFLGTGSQITHRYTLRIKWDEAASGSQYSQQQQSIKITINAEQVD